MIQKLFRGYKTIRQARMMREVPPQPSTLEAIYNTCRIAIYDTRRAPTLEATQGQICQSLIDATRSVNLPQMPPDSGGICMGFD